jgi:probable F420-dependent oxidoreductase
VTTIVPAGQLAVGMQLQVQTKSRTFREDWEDDADSSAIAALARQADAVGFFYIAVSDHVAVPKPFDERMQTTWYDTVTTLGWLAGITERVRLMSHVYVLAYRHPLQTAKSFMTLDELSGGRAILGTGVGHLQREFELLGVDYDDRGAITNDAIDVIRAAFADEYPDVTTPRFGHIQDAGLAPRPRQRAIPIWVGGSSKAALRRAGERGDGWLPQGTPRAEMPASIAYLLEHRKQTVGDVPIDLGVIAETIYVGDPAWDVGGRTITGDPEHVAERLNEFGAMGVSHVQVRFRSRDLEEHLDQMAAFGATVLPHLHR